MIEWIELNIDALLELNSLLPFKTYKTKILMEKNKGMSLKDLINLAKSYFNDRVYEISKP